MGKKTQSLPPGIRVQSIISNYLTPTLGFESQVLGCRLSWGTNDESLVDVVNAVIDEKWGQVVVPDTGHVTELSILRCPLEGHLDANPNSSIDMVGYLKLGLSIVTDTQSNLALFEGDVSTVVLRANSSENATRQIIDIAIEASAKRPPLFQVHASGVAIGDQGILFVGESGMGKSTLSGGLCLIHGYRYLGDDALLVDTRSGTIYGNPWEVEIRSDIAEFLVAEGYLERDNTVVRYKASRTGKKKWVLDSSRFLEIATSATTTPIVFFLAQGDAFSLKELSIHQGHERLRPAPLFFGRSDSDPRWEKAYQTAFGQTRFFRLTLDHSMDVFDSVGRVHEALDGFITTPTD